MKFARVALDVPLGRLFDYRADTVDAVDTGSIVLVPFGKKIAVGVVMEMADTSSLAPSRLRSLLDVLRDLPRLPPDVLAILQFCSDYYRHPIGEVVLNALPTRLRRRNAIKPQRRSYRLTAAGMQVDPESLPARARAQRDLLAHLRRNQNGIDAAAFRRQFPRAGAVLKELVRREWVESLAATPVPTTQQILPGPALNDAQQIAVDAIRPTFGRFAPYLLHGITGSGKTEVYLELIASALLRKQQTLLLVPEINLTPQLDARIQSRFPDTQIVRLNSALNESERLQNWLDAQSGRAGIILGTRLAVFTPLPDLGLIIVDEEHDASFKQSDGLRYSARDIALLRAKQRSLPIVLGSATPALETYHQALGGRYSMLTLANRPKAMPPDIATIDVRGETLIDGLSQAALHAIKENTARKEQTLVYVNRRGYAPVLICPGCGWTSGCPRCSVKLVVHLKNRLMCCHHCGHQEKIPVHCPQCGGAELAPLGQGTQRVESALARIFPAARILRIDRDTTRKKDAWNQMRRQIHEGEVDLLVGTQILAKGHDFPALTLVCVINADASLYSMDYRASERLFANLMQVSGRAGRADKPGRVLIQTEFPQHPLYVALQRQNYADFAQTVLAERQQAGLPPYTYQAILRVEALKLDTAIGFLRKAARCADTSIPEVTVFDPVPAHMTRLAGKERAQLTVQSRTRGALHRFIGDWEPKLEKLAETKVRWALDIDPLDS
ncbi:MAG: primosomal protein N' [Betaproteobacteria bacterium]|nr:primosomal protein N' [Betaproteobacteria bacterium]